ncbi:MAG: galactose-1-phosphate uridylyltransferase [Candidatus Omnitrophota bacterium]
MSQLRRDPIVGRWVIVNTEDPKGPNEFEVAKHEFTQEANCPFCAGNEKLTPPEVDAIRTKGTQPDTPGWSVRVVPNKFPALTIEGDLNREGVGIYDMSNGIGAHEVIIENPEHRKTFTDLSAEQIKDVIDTSCRRAISLTGDKRFKYILLFKNYGVDAGASLEHGHAQLIALPMIPKNAHEELNGAHRYFEFHERCIYCDIIRQEKQEKSRIICENESFIAFCPFVSRFPFQVWIIAKTHSPYFCHMSEKEKISLSKILKDVLLRIKVVLNDPSYNFIFHTSPLEIRQAEGFHWYVELMPKLTRVAGFEWGSGFYIVPTDPETAAGYLKQASVTT